MDEQERPSARRASGTIKARKRNRRPLTKVDRIAYIVGVMAQNQWVTGVTGPQLAAKWKLSVDTVAKDAQEASRTFNADPAERGAWRARWYAKIESAQKLAAKKGRLEALASLLKLEGDHLGAFELDDSDPKTTHRVEVVFTDGGEEPEGS